MADGATVSVMRSRPTTPDIRTDDGLTIIRAKRCCNGCGRQLGDATQAELEAAVAGVALPDVRGECGCDRGLTAVADGLVRDDQ